MIKQWKLQSSGPVNKNHQLRTNGRTVYKIDFVDADDDGYYSDCKANSEATYDFNAHFTVYDNTGDDDGNGEGVLEGKKLNASAAAAAKSRPPSILKGKTWKKLYKSSEMPAGAVSKIMAKKTAKID